MGQKIQQQTMVLVLEDSPMYGEVLSLMIERGNGMAFLADGLELAQSFAQSLRFDLVTVDLNIAEGMSGTDIIDHIGFRNNPLYTSVPKMIIITSEILTPHEKQKLLDMGYEDVLQKPVCEKALHSYMPTTELQEESSHVPTWKEPEISESKILDPTFRPHGRYQ